jgi:phosphatidylinositol-bisphosphatase
VQESWALWYSREHAFHGILSTFIPQGNKGATAIRMSYTPSAPDISPSPTVLTFVNAHLAAFDEMVERRNFDFHELSRRLVFYPSEELVPDANAEVEYPRKSSGLFESDVLFWMVRFY